MNEGNLSDLLEPAGNAMFLKMEPGTDARGILDELVREGARRMLQAALEEEVNSLLAANYAKVDASGRRLVVRNGYMPSRELGNGSRLDLCRSRLGDLSPTSFSLFS